MMPVEQGRRPSKKAATYAGRREGHAKLRNLFLWRWCPDSTAWTDYPFARRCEFPK